MHANKEWNHLNMFRDVETLDWVRNVCINAHIHAIYRYVFLYASWVDGPKYFVVYIPFFSEKREPLTNKRQIMMNLDRLAIQFYNYIMMLKSASFTFSFQQDCDTEMTIFSKVACLLEIRRIPIVRGYNVHHRNDNSSARSKSFKILGSE